MKEGNLKYFNNTVKQEILSRYSGSSGYIFFESWPGGFNNIRMSYELAICLCYLTNRTLVLPPKQKMYLLEDECTFNDLFNLSSILIKFLTFEEFCQLNKDVNTLEDLKKISTLIEKKLDTVCLIDNGCELNEDFIRGREVIRLEQIVDDSRIIYFNQNLLGTFYINILTNRKRELLYLIYKSAVFKSEIFDKASTIINNLPFNSYHSVHIRRNDFQYKELFIDGETLQNNIVGHIPTNSNLYIATDHPVQEPLFDKLKSTFNCIFFKDVKKYIGDTPPNWVPLIEMLICSRGVTFIGNELSTFSSYIYRIRGYMNDIQDRRFLVNTEQYDKNYQPEFIKNTYFRGSWSREYPDVWNF